MTENTYDDINSLEADFLRTYRVPEEDDLDPTPPLEYGLPENMIHEGMGLHAGPLGTEPKITEEDLV